MGILKEWTKTGDEENMRENVVVGIPRNTAELSMPFTCVYLGIQYKRGIFSFLYYVHAYPKILG